MDGVTLTKPDLPRTDAPRVEPVAAWRSWGQLKPSEKFSVYVLAVSPLALLGLWWGKWIGPNSLPAGGKGATGLAPPALLIAGVMVWLSAQIGGALALSTLPWPRDLTSLTLKAQAVVSAGYYGLGLVVGLAMVSMATRKLSAQFAWGDLVLGPMVLAAVFPVVTLASTVASAMASLVFKQAVDPVAHETLAKLVDARDDAWAWPVGLGAILVAPVIEEIVFRFFLQGALVGALKSIKVPGLGGGWLAVVLASGLFTAVHYSAVPWYAMPALFVLSLGLGAAYHRTGRLSVPIAMHAGFNALNVAMAVWGG